MRTLYPILILTLTLCFGGPLFAEETTQTETAKGAKGTSQPQAQTVPKPEAKKEAPPAAQPQSSPALAPAAQPAPPSRPTPQLGEGTITHETKLIGGKPAHLVWVEESSNSNAYTPHDARITHVADKPIPEVKEIPQAINQILFPGESCTFAGVTIQWEVNGNEMPKSETEWVPLGPLHVRGPVNRIEDIDLGLQVNSKRTFKTMSVQTMAYVDNVYVTCSSGPGQGTDVRLGLYAQYIPNHQEYAPKTQTRANVYLSSVCPTSLNQWDLNLSDKPVKAADGSDLLKITARNRETGETHEAAARREASLRFGRFALKVENVCFQNRTVTFEASVEYDKTIRGRNAVLVYNSVTAASCDNKSLGEVLDHVAKECGFEVEWSGFEGFGPEAGKYVRELPVKNYFGIYSTGIGGGGGTLIPVEALLLDLQKKLRNTFEPVWTDDTHLRIRPIGYEEYKKEKEKAATIEQFEKELPDRRGKAIAQFEKEYVFETRMYRLKSISPEAAAQLIRTKLTRYQLVEQPYHFQHNADGTVQLVNDEGSEQIHTVERTKGGEEPASASKPIEGTKGTPPPETPKPLASVEETAVADSRTNSLLVTALPKTQELIGETLGRMEDAFEQELKSVAEKAVPRRRLEVVLLQGTTNDSEETSTSEFRGYFGMGGMIEKILVKPGQTVKKGDLLAQLDKRMAEAQYEEAVTHLKREQAVLEEKKNLLKTAEQQFAVGTLPESGVAAARLAVKEQDARLVQPEQMVRAREIHLKMCELRAPENGVVTEVLAQPREEFRPAGSNTQPVLKMTLKPQTTSPDGGKAAPVPTEEEETPVLATAKKYGINPDDLKFFHFTDLEERGRTILTLGETTGKEGKAAADLGGGPYRCEFEYQAWRTPYLVVNARLQGPSSGEAGSKPKGLIENTLYLQEGVPSVLGITNLREGLILVVRLAAPPAQPASTDQPAPAPSAGAAPPDTEAK